MHLECLTGEMARVLSGLRGVVERYHFIMAGGTALALRMGHRISEDIDFFTDSPFSTEKLYKEITDQSLSPQLIQEEEGTLAVMVRGIKGSFFHYPYPFIDGEEKYRGIPVAGIYDIASMKVIAICQRGVKKDFIDLYYILQDTPFRKIAENMVKRFGASRINPLNIGKSLAFFDDAESDPEPRYLGESYPNWGAVKIFFRRNLKQMVLDIGEAMKG